MELKQQEISISGRNPVTWETKERFQNNCKNKGTYPLLIIRHKGLIN